MGFSLVSVCGKISICCWVTFFLFWGTATLVQIAKYERREVEPATDSILITGSRSGMGKHAALSNSSLGVLTQQIQCSKGKKQ